MSDKRAFITGINGQDGSYLAELLLEKGYTVIGLERRTALNSSEKNKNLLKILDHNKFIVEQGDVSDFASIYSLISKYRPNEVYNLSAQSHVGTSYKSPVSTIEINFTGCLNLLESIRMIDSNIKFYQASTSEMFGDSTKSPQNENSSFSPVSPYACSKVAAHHLVSTYRKSYNLFACCGILFNHESPRRGEDFVTRKITKAAARIKLGKQSELRLGNLDAYRDWGFAGDYVKAMWMMLQHPTPDDYVIATGESNTVREFLQHVFDRAGLKVEDHLKIDPNLSRPYEVSKMWGDFSKAKTILGWQPDIGFRELANLMFDEDYAEEKRNIFLDLQ